MRGAAVPVRAAATLVALAGAVLPTRLPAQEPGIVTALDTTTITVGDRLTLEATVEHAPDAFVLWPDSLDLAPFEVIEVDTLPASRSGGRAMSARRVVLTAFELGTLELPPLIARIVSAEGDTTRVASDRWRVEVVSVGLDEEGGIREIRGPRSMPVGLGAFLPWLVVALALGALGWWWLRRGGAVAEESAAATHLERPPDEVALEALGALEAADLPGRGELKRFHVEVSDIVRSYLERRLGVPALESTTGELLAMLTTARVGPEVPREVRRDLRLLLERCDLVKFAKFEPSADESRELVPLARSIVERTRPAPPETDAPADVAPAAEVESPAGGAA